MEDQRETPVRGDWALVAIAWTAVSVPLLWGIWITCQKAALLFR